MSYVTPPGVWEAEVELPEEYAHLAQRGVHAVKWYDHVFLVGADFDLSFFEEMAKRQKSKENCIFIITGTPGKGKSWFGLKLGEIFDPKFKILDVDEMPPPGEDTSQVTFERPHLLYLIGNDSPLDRGEYIMVDEAQYAMGSRRWFEEVQRDVVEQIESVRSRGFIICIIALHLSLLDKIIRQFMLAYMVGINARGEATIYRLYTPRFADKMHQKKIGTLHVTLPGVDELGYAHGAERIVCPLFLQPEEGPPCWQPVQYIW